MRAEKQGSGYVVVVDADEVAEFARQWPASNLNPEVGKEFHFDDRNGDLVDYNSVVDGVVRSPDGDEDGPALAALSEDAGLFGARELDLEDVVAIRSPAGPRP